MKLLRLAVVALVLAGSAPAFGQQMPTRAPLQVEEDSTSTAPTAAGVVAYEQPRGSSEPSAAGANATPLKRALATGVAVVPGFVAHGAGSYTLGRTALGHKLLALQGVGLGGLLLGGIPIGLTGASRYIVGPAATTVVLGIGTFGIAWLADIYGSAAGSRRGRLRLSPPEFIAEAGYMYVYDPQFDYRHFATQGLELHLGPWHGRADAALSPDDSNWRMRLIAGYRFWQRGASYLELQAGYLHHRYPRERFHANTAELALHGRLDLEQLDEHLRGSFAELGTGIAIRVVDFQLPGNDAAQQEEVLLARFAFGFALDSNGSEVEVSYDHRHDDYAAGLKISGLGSGVAGHFGLGGRYFFDQRWGVSAQARVGSAYITNLSLLFREDYLP